MAVCQRNTKQAHKEANSVAEQLQQVVDDFVQELPINFLDEKTLDSLYKNLKGSVDGVKRSLAESRLRDGIKIERTKISKEAAHEAIFTNRVMPALRDSFDGIKELGESLRGLKSLKDYNLLRDHRVAMTNLMENVLPENLRAEFIKDGASLEAFEKVVAGMDHQQRLDVMVNLQDGFPVEFDKVKQALSEVDAKNIRIERAMDTLQALEDIEFQVNGAIDLATMYARNPYEEMLELSPQFVQQTEAFSNSTDRNVINEQFADDKLQNTVKNQFGKLTESMSSKLMKSKVPGAQMFAMFILETPSGFGGEIVRPNTASIRADMLHKRSIHEVNTAYRDMLDKIAEIEGWSPLKRQIMQDGHSRTHPEIRAINEQVALHINDLKLGRASDAPPHIKEYAAIQTREYHKIHDASIGKVAGITKDNKITHYDQQIMNDHRFNQLITNADSRNGMVELLRRGLIGGGMEDDLAQEVATAVVQQKMNAMNRKGLKSSNLLGEQDLAGLMPRLQDVVNQMESNNVRPADVARFVEAYQAGAGDQMPGYANGRLNFDLAAEHTINGEKVRILDLMEKDMPGNFDKYSKEANGRIAISEAIPGLDSDAAINDYIFNTGKQAQMMGTSVDTKAMRNVINIMLGLNYEGQLPMDVRKVRDLVSLAGMGGLGESQLAETGMAMNRGISGMIGTAQMLHGRKAKRGMARGIELTDDQMNSARFLSEQEELTGLFQESHRIVRRNIHYDQVDSDFGALSKIIDVGTGGRFRNVLKAAQDRFTGYGAIRSMQDQLAMSGLLQDINRARRGEIPFTSKARFRDLGIDVDQNNVFFRNMDEFATFKADGTIENLNIHKWSPADRDTAGIILNRHAAQVVQKGFVGEMSPLMSNPWVAFMMQFRNYPLLAAEKQQARNLKFADKEAATGLFLNAASSSGARIIRYASVASAQPLGERQDYFERQLQKLPNDTWAYMGNAGMTPQLYRYATQLMGHPFGLGKDGYAAEGLHTEIPVLSYATKTMQAHDRLTNGEPMNDNDYARLQSLAPLGTIGFVNILAGIFRTGLNQ